MAAKKDKIEVYPTIEVREPEGALVVWRWRYQRSNGSIIAGPQESYTKRVHCIRMAKQVTGFDYRDDLTLVGPHGADWSHEA